MTDHNILSCNINGLNGPHKHTGFLDFMRRRKIDIVLVQESHLKEEDIHRHQSSVVCVMCSRLMFPYLVCFLSLSDVIIS